MSTKSSFLEQLGPRVRVQAVDPIRTGTSARVNLRADTALGQTVPLARALIRRGVKGSVARDVADRLASGAAASVLLPHHDGQAFAEEIAGLGVFASVPKRVSGQALATLRKRLQLSQEQFANSIGLEVRTLQNWEQQRGALDAPTALLIKVLEHFPELVQRVAADDALPSFGEPPRA